MAKTRNEKSSTPSRRGKVGINLYVHDDDHRRLKQLALDKDKSLTGLCLDGINMVLRKYRMRTLRD